ncbi:MAG TPA: hypothetical protein VF913_00415 [Xanthobacteraceae bacterium]
MSEVSGSSWWQTLPGVLTAVGGLLTAVTGLVLALNQIGVFSTHTSSSRPDRPPSVVVDHRQQQGPSFDCKTDRGLVEQAICGDAELAARDLVLDDLFLKERDRLSGQARADLLEAQRIWVGKRNQCRDPGMAACITQSYDARIRELRAAARQ